jgi:ABC-type multidrug transport system fused ATPase/permease subunit
VCFALAVIGTSLFTQGLYETKLNRSEINLLLLLLVVVVVVVVAVAAAVVLVTVWVVVVAVAAAVVVVVVVVVAVAAAAVVVVVVLYTPLYGQATYKYFPDSFHTYRIFKQDPLSRVFSSLQNVTMTKVHGDHKAPELNGTSAPRTC